MFLFVLDRGTVQKVIVLPRDDLQTEELVLEEVEVFKVSLEKTKTYPKILFLFVLLPRDAVRLVLNQT